MTTKPKTRKAPAKAAPEEPYRSHRAVVMTVEQRDKLNDILRLMQAVRLAILGTELCEYERVALSALAACIDDQMTALTNEFDAFAEGEAA